MILTDNNEKITAIPSPLDQSPILVTGTQRSGTTLLHHILECSAEIWSRNELYPIHKLVYAKRVFRREQKIRAQLLALLKLDISLVPKQSEADDPVSYLRTVLSFAAKANGKSRWCLKDPAISYYLHEYARAWGDAKFVIIIRDPRAVCRSYLSCRGFKVGRPANLLAAGMRWRDEVATQIRFKKAFPDRVLVIHYESLISNLSQTLGMVCKFLHTPLTDAMANYHRSSTQILIHEGNKNILQRPDLNRLDAWRREFSTEETAVIEAVVKDVMEQVGYTAESSPRRIRSSQLYIARVHDWLVREYRWQLFKYGLS